MPNLNSPQRPHESPELEPAFAAIRKAVGARRWRDACAAAEALARYLERIANIEKANDEADGALRTLRQCEEYIDVEVPE